MLLRDIFNYFLIILIFNSNCLLSKDDDSEFTITDESDSEEQCTSCGTPNSRASYETDAEAYREHASQNTQQRRGPPNQEQILKYVEDLQKRKELEDMQEELKEKLPELDEFSDEAYDSIKDFIYNKDLSPNTFGCGTVMIKPGTFFMGSEDDENYEEDGESPVKKVKLRKAFWMDACEVTNAQYLEFWSHPQTAMRGDTEAEKYGWTFVFENFVSQDVNKQIHSAVHGAEWWIPVPKADFRHPEGPDTNFNDRLDHPVIHVGWTDSIKYCYAHGGRLPTEAEWEYAARGGLEKKKWPWGDVMHPNLTTNGEYSMNIFTGDPYKSDNGADGYQGTAPVGTYYPNGYGLYDMTGNVWEWVNDFWTDRPKLPPSGKRLVDPKGPKKGRDRVMKGGSFMCHIDTCRRYRCSGRTHAEPDSSTGNLGFRCVYDKDPEEMRREAQTKRARK